MNLLSGIWMQKYKEILNNLKVLIIYKIWVIFPWATIPETIQISLEITQT